MTLISRLEQAEAGSRELDAEIENALGLAKFDRDPKVGFGDADYNRREPKPYSTSIDAAMSLAGESPQPSEIMRDALWLVNKKHSLHICTWPKTLSFQNELALALCIASLMAAGYE